MTSRNLRQRPTKVNAEQRAEQLLRYAVQKVANKWLVHHMAGRCTAEDVNTAPGGFAAFDYTQLEGVTAQAGTFRKTS